FFPYCFRRFRRQGALLPLPSTSLFRSVDVSVAGEWSFAETLRHLVMATDTWLRKAIVQEPQPYHPIGRPDSSFGGGDEDPSVFSTTDPTYEEVLAVRAGAGRDGARPPRHRHAGAARRGAAQPARRPLRGDRALLPAHDPRGGVGAPPVAVRDLDAIEAGAA